MAFQERFQQRKFKAPAINSLDALRALAQPDTSPLPGPKFSVLGGIHPTAWPTLRLQGTFLQVTEALRAQSSPACTGVDFSC